MHSRWVCQHLYVRAHPLDRHNCQCSKGRAPHVQGWPGQSQSGHPPSRVSRPAAPDWRPQCMRCAPRHLSHNGPPAPPDLHSVCSWCTRHLWDDAVSARQRLWNTFSAFTSVKNHPSNESGSSSHMNLLIICSKRLVCSEDAHSLRFSV